jgi:hypothetical protein
MKINYFLNSTCGGIKEICFYDEDKYDEGLAFGHELYIDVYYPEYDIEGKIKELNAKYERA